jgi:hypothetical protein
VQWSAAFDQQQAAVAPSVSGAEALFQLGECGLLLAELIAEHQDADCHGAAPDARWVVRLDGTASAIPTTSQPAGPAGHGAGITPFDQPLLGAEGAVAAIHHEALAVSLLVVDPQP